MPTTRALSARLQARQPAQSNCTSHEDITAIKARQAQQVQRDELKPQLMRNVSSPVCMTTSAGHQSSQVHQPQPDGGSKRPVTRANSLRRSCSSFSSSRRSVLGSDHVSDSEPSDDELDLLGRDRLGGCSQQSQTSTEPDDSNKENVAPFRCASEDVLMVEARDAQEESIARRARASRRSSLMERRTSTCSSSSSSTATSCSLTARLERQSLHRSSSQSDTRSVISSSSSLPRTPTRRMARTQSDGMLSTPRTLTRNSNSSSNSIITTSSNGGRKRARQLDDADEDQEDVRLAPSPLSRMRVGSRRVPVPASISLPGVNENDADLCFNSQASVTTCTSELFDVMSQSEASTSDLTAATSRATTPASEHVPGAGANKNSIERYSNVYAHARALLRYAAGVDPAETEAGLTICAQRQSESQVKVVGRAKERVAIEHFLDKRLGLFPHAHDRANELKVRVDGDPESGCLYVCGLPGTGKTALVRSVLSDLTAAAATKTRPPRIAFVNCMTLTHPRFVFGKVLSALGSDAAEGQSDVEAEKALTTLIREGGQRILIVLDEMDHLLRSRAHQNVLYRLFSWATPAPATPGARLRANSCSLIGIANSLDLTERFVPLLASKGASPALLHFRPFEAPEINQVIRDRLSGLYAGYDDVAAAVPMPVPVQNELPLFTSAAVELLSKKIAAATGDLRKALDAARLAVELVETEQRKQASLSESTPGRGKALSHLTPATAARVGPKEILKVLSTVLGSPSLGKIRSLGLQPKLVLLAMLVVQQGDARSAAPGPGRALSVSEVEARYHAMLRVDGGFSRLESSELLAVFELLEVQAVLSLSGTEVAAGCSRSLSSSSSSPSAKRAAKKQLLASNRSVQLLLSTDDVLRGITTGTPIAEALLRMWNTELDRIARASTWQQVALEKELVRREELGGGRGQVAIGL